MARQKYTVLGKGKKMGASGGKLSPFFPLLKLSAFLACFLRGNDRDRDREG